MTQELWRCRTCKQAKFQSEMCRWRESLCKACYNVKTRARHHAKRQAKKERFAAQATVPIAAQLSTTSQPQQVDDVAALRAELQAVKATLARLHNVVRVTWTASTPYVQTELYDEVLKALRS